MSFSANPLSLSMPDSAFEAWLRENHFLEILDDRTSAIAAPAGGPLPAASSDLSAAARTTQRAAAGMSLLSLGATVASLLTVNPFSKLAAADFAGETPPWTLSFFGPAGSLSWPASPSQVRMRVHENVKRYARNYSILAALFLACSLYQMPVALLGLIMCLLLWEVFRIGVCKLRLERFPILRQIFLYAIQCVIVIVLIICNAQKAVFYAVCTSYAVMLFHASLRKLTPMKLPMPLDNHRRLLKKR